MNYVIGFALIALGAMCVVSAFYIQHLHEREVGHIVKVDESMTRLKLLLDWGVQRHPVMMADFVEVVGDYDLSEAERRQFNELGSEIVSRLNHSRQRKQTDNRMKPIPNKGEMVRHDHED